MILHLMKYNPRFLSWDGFARDILTSSTLLNLLLALGLSGALETAMHRLQLPFPLEDAKRGTLRHGADLLSSLEGRNWTAVEMALNGLDVSLLQPLYDTFVTNGIFTIVQFSIPLGGVAYYMTDFLRGICPFSVHELMVK